MRLIQRRTAPTPHNVEIVKDARGEPPGVFLERNYAPILEYTLFRVLPRFTHEDRVEGVRLGARAYSAAGTTAAFEGHGLTPAVIRAYRRLTREEALRLVIQSGHLLTWSEDRRGSLEPGKQADLVVLDGYPLTCPEDEIKDLPVDMTMVGGQIVHARTRPSPSTTRANAASEEQAQRGPDH